MSNDFLRNLLVSFLYKLVPSYEGIRQIVETAEPLDPALMASVVTSIVVFVIELILYRKRLIFSGVRNKITTAKEEGNIIIAKQVSKNYPIYQADKWDRNNTATYEYTYRGKKRRKTVLSKNLPLPDTLEMYYTNRSPKPVSVFDIVSPFIMLIYIIPPLLGTAVAYALGFRG